MNGTALVKLGEREFALIDPQGTVLHTYKYPFVGYPGMACWHTRLPRTVNTDICG